MAVKYNDYGELTMAGTSLKTLAQSFGTTIVYDEDEIRNQMRRYHSLFKKWFKNIIFHMLRKHLHVSKWSN